MVTDDFHVQHGICWYILVYFGQLWKIMIHLGISRSLGWVPKMVWPLAMVQPVGCRPGVKRLLLRSATVQCFLSCIVANDWPANQNDPDIRSFPQGWPPQIFACNAARLKWYLEQGWIIWECSRAAVPNITYDIHIYIYTEHIHKYTRISISYR